METDLVVRSVARDVIGWCRALAAHSEERTGITRMSLSEPMHGVHRDLSAWMTRLGMTVEVDAAGNLRGLRPASASPAPRLYIGSHLDTVPEAGAFDGILGVVWGIAVVESLQGTPLACDIEVIGFSDEEGVRFGEPFIGSRAFVGTLDDDLLARRDEAGVSVGEALGHFGLDVSALDRARAVPQALGYLECHIEQGPVLDHLHLPLGIVDRIVGQTRAQVTFTGAAGHAGTTPMTLRRDAVASAAEWILAVEHEARVTSDLVATTGQIHVRPGAVNVIAGQSVVSLDVRHPDDAVRAAAVGRLKERAIDVGARRGLAVEWVDRLDQPSVVMDQSLTARLDGAVERCGYPLLHMASGAGHDAMIVAGRMPAAMLFVRSPGGISHHPDESVVEDDITAALAVGRQFVIDIAGAVRA